jgi:succinate dehydrogenase / fumarate reductase flavoprotein subunit
VRESNVHRLAEVSANIIDQCVSQGVPLAREYGGLLQSFFGGTLVSRTFMQRANRTTIAFRAYSAMNRQIGRGK